MEENKKYIIVGKIIFGVCIIASATVLTLVFKNPNYLGVLALLLLLGE